MTPRIRKPKHKRIYIPDPMRFSFGVAAASLDSFKALPLHEQGVMLLRRFAEFVPEGQTFYPHSVSRSWSGGRDDWNQISYGFPSSEPWDAKRYLLTHPLSEIVRAGYIAEAPPGSGRYRFTAEGRAVVMSYISPVWGGTRAPAQVHRMVNGQIEETWERHEAHEHPRRVLSILIICGSGT